MILVDFNLFVFSLDLTMTLTYFQAYVVFVLMNTFRNLYFFHLLYYSIEFMNLHDYSKKVRLNVM